MAKILLVDDDDDLLYLMGEYLDAYGVQFETADCVAQARNRLKHSRFDAIISDYNMPGGTGLDLFRYVSARYRRVPFILMTGCVDSRVKREALKMGISGYIEKPFHLKELVQVVSAITEFMARKTQRLASTA